MKHVVVVAIFYVVIVTSVTGTTTMWAPVSSLICLLVITVTGFGQYNIQSENNQDVNNVVVCYCHCLLVVISILFTVGWPNPV